MSQAEGEVRLPKGFAPCSQPAAPVRRRGGRNGGLRKSLPQSYYAHFSDDRRSSTQMGEAPSAPLAPPDSTPPVFTGSFQRNPNERPAMDKGSGRSKWNLADVTALGAQHYPTIVPSNKSRLPKSIQGLPVDRAPSASLGGALGFARLPSHVKHPNGSAFPHAVGRLSSTPTPPPNDGSMHPVLASGPRNWERERSNSGDGNALPHTNPTTSSPTPTASHTSNATHMHTPSPMTALAAALASHITGGRSGALSPEHAAYILRNVYGGGGGSDPVPYGGPALPVPDDEESDPVQLDLTAHPTPPSASSATAAVPSNSPDGDLEGSGLWSTTGRRSAPAPAADGSVAASPRAFRSVSHRSGVLGGGPDGTLAHAAWGAAFPGGGAGGPRQCGSPVLTRQPSDKSSSPRGRSSWCEASTSAVGGGQLPLGAVAGGGSGLLALCASLGERYGSGQDGVVGGSAVPSLGVAGCSAPRLPAPSASDSLWGEARSTSGAHVGSDLGPRLRPQPLWGGVSSSNGGEAGDSDAVLPRAVSEPPLPVGIAVVGRTPLRAGRSVPAAGDSSSALGASPFSPCSPQGLEPGSLGGAVGGLSFESDVGVPCLRGMLDPKSPAVGARSGAGAGLSPPSTCARPTAASSALSPSRVHPLPSYFSSFSPTPPRTAGSPAQPPMPGSPERLFGWPAVGPLFEGEGGEDLSWDVVR